MATTKRWTKKDELKLINDTQDFYVSELISRLNNPSNSDMVLKTINFTSPTGSGKTKMIAKLINRMPDCYFIITSLSKGQLANQIEDSLRQDIVGSNYIVYASQKLTRVSVLTDKDILDDIYSHHNYRLIWIRDEGHIHTNSWMKTLEKECDKIINFSATNTGDAGIVCNFTHTLMLRTVIQQEGSIDDAIKKLIEIKKEHASVLGYTPCALFRLTSSILEKEIIKKCEESHLKHISLIDNNDFIMSDLCRDDNEYDVIINKQKIVEGIDIRRAHVIWIENEPANSATTIQLIGRCRRNALLWKDDIDILSAENASLLKSTRICYAFYNVSKMKIDTDNTGELAVAFCPFISVQEIKPDCVVRVKNGQMQNGLHITELEGCTGEYNIKIDNRTGFNYVDSPYYKEEIAFDNIPQNTKNFLMHLNPINCWFSSRKESYWNNFINAIDRVTKSNGEYFRIKNNGDIISLGYRYSSDELSTMIYTIQVYTNCGDIILTSSELNQLALHHKLEVSYLSPLRFFNCSYANISIYNCFDSAILGGDTFTQSKRGGKRIWTNNTSITAKIAHHSKLDAFIDSIYALEIQTSESLLYSGHNPYNFGNKRINSCLGYCVEYYSKYLILGEKYLYPFIQQIRNDRKELTDSTIIVRACILKYKKMMALAFGESVDYVIPSISIDALNSNHDFIATVQSLAYKTSLFLRKRLSLSDISKHSHILSVKGIVGLIDITDGKTIIDIKTTGHIDRSMIKQVLTYHYLSSFRLDMNVNKVIVYDAIADRHVELEPRRVVSRFLNDNYSKLKGMEQFIRNMSFPLSLPNPYINNLLSEDRLSNNQTDQLIREHYIKYGQFERRNQDLFIDTNININQNEYLEDINMFKAALFAVEELNYSLTNYLKNVCPKDICIYSTIHQHENSIICSISDKTVMIGKYMIFNQKIDYKQLLCSIWDYCGHIIIPYEKRNPVMVQFFVIKKILINNSNFPIMKSFCLLFDHDYLAIKFEFDNFEKIVYFDDFQSNLKSCTSYKAENINNEIKICFLD